MSGVFPDEVHITRSISPILTNENSMTRNTSFLVKFSIFLVILLVLETRSYDIESAMKKATVGPNVYLGSDGVKGKFTFVVLGCIYVVTLKTFGVDFKAMRAS